MPSYRRFCEKVMPTLHIHIGTLKTGTTSIESFLTHNREKLLKKGYLYPTSGTGKAGYLHKCLCQSIDSRRPYNPLKNEWIEEWENQGYFILNLDLLCCHDNSSF